MSPMVGKSLAVGRLLREWEGREAFPEADHPVEFFFEGKIRILWKIVGVG